MNHPIAFITRTDSGLWCLEDRDTVTYEPTYDGAVAIAREWFHDVEIELVPVRFEIRPKEGA